MVYLVSVWKLLEIDPWLLQWVLLSFGGASQCSAETKVIFDALDILHGVIAWEVAEYKTKLINNTLRGSLMSQQTVNKGMLRDIWCDLRIACDCTSSCRTKWSTQPVDKGKVGELHRCNWWLLLWGWSLWITLWICEASHVITLYTHLMNFHLHIFGFSINQTFWFFAGSDIGGGVPSFRWILRSSVQVNIFKYF